jgi:hypothetical protein
MDSSLLFVQPTKTMQICVVNGLWKGGNLFMLKKTIPFFLISALVLGGCNMNGNNDVVPNNNETPMQDNVPDRDRNWTPNANDNNQGGTDLDGIDDGQNGGNNGFINGDNGDDNGVNNGNGAPNDTIIDDEMDGNKTNR